MYGDAYAPAALDYDIGDLDRRTVEEKTSGAIILHGGVFDREGRSAPAENSPAGTILDGEPLDRHPPGSVDSHHTIKHRRATTAPVEHRTAAAVERDPVGGNRHPFMAGAGDTNRVAWVSLV